MSYSITREDPELDLDALRDVIDNTGPGYGSHPRIFEVLRDLADSIEEQVKPVVEEPQEFASVVRAGFDSRSDRTLWVRGHKGGWQSDDGAFTAIWQSLHEPEVLRVGTGDPRQEYADAFNAGSAAKAEGIRARLRGLRAVAITAPEQEQLDKAIRECR